MAAFRFLAAVNWLSLLWWCFVHVWTLLRVSGGEEVLNGGLVSGVCGARWVHEGGRCGRKMEFTRTGRCSK